MHCEEALEGGRVVPDRDAGREDEDVGFGMKRSCRNVCVCVEWVARQSLHRRLLPDLHNGF